MTITTSGTNPITIEAVSNTTTTSSTRLQDFNVSLIGVIDPGVTVDGFGLELTSTLAGSTISFTNDGTVTSDQNNGLRALQIVPGAPGNFGTFTYSGSGNVTNTGNGGALLVDNQGTGNVDITISGTSTISGATVAAGVEASTGTGTVQVTVQSNGLVEGQVAVSLGGGIDTLDNSGTVQGMGTLSTGVVGQTATVINSGTISGTTEGSGVNNLTLTNNSGAMIETAGTTAGEAAVAAIAAVEALTADITNKSGATIQATGPFGQIGILVTGTATVDNAGAISGPEDGINTNTTEATTITNSGSIAATTRSGIRVNTATVENDNGGTISGLNGVFFRNPAPASVFNASSVFNDGTITGTGSTPGFGATPIAIHFSTGSTGNTLTLGTNSVINGNVLGAGSDILQLGGTGSASFDLGNIGAAAQYQGFSTFNKIDTSTWTLTGTGAEDWTVAQGTLQVDGTIGNATVESGGILDGTGTTGALTLESGGTLAPGDSPGPIATGNLNLQAGSGLSIEIQGTSPGVGGFDQVVVNGSVTLAGTLSTTLLNGFTPQGGATFEIINNDGADAVNGTFAGLPEGASFTLGGTTFSISYVGGDGNDVVLTASVGLSGAVTLTSATEGTALANNTAIATFADSNLADTTASFTATIDWGDGTTTAGSAVTVVGSNGSFTVEGGHTYADEGNDMASVTLTRTADQVKSTVSGSVAVAEHDALSAQAMTLTGNQGQPLTNVTVATFSDTDTVTPAGDFVATINWGDGTTSAGSVFGSNGAFTVNGSHTYATAGQDNVTVTVTDDAPGTAAATATSTANISAANIGLAGQVVLTSATEHVALPSNTVVATYADGNLGDTAASFTATINWGDGTTDTGMVSGSNGSFTVSGGHSYADEGNFSVSASLVRTSDQETGTSSGSVAVAEHDALLVQGKALTGNQGQALSNVTVATFTDTDTAAPANDFVASINWGDGITTTGTVAGANGAFSVSGTHTYATAGHDIVTVTVTDDAPGTATASATGSATITGAALRYIGLGDYDANSRTDIAWASNGGGHATLWMNNNGTLSQFATPGAMGSEWTAIGVGDFNADGNSDLLWTNTTGQAAVWELNGPNLIGVGVSAGQMGSEWHVAAIGDFNGDHKSDLLWVSDTGSAAVWSMNGTTLGGFAVSNGHMGTEWSVIGTADFNHDGREDVLWENTSGTVDIWEMNGANLSGFDQNVGTAPASSHFAGVGHFTGAGPLASPGASDIVWVDSTNHVTIWEINNGHVANTVNLNGLDGLEWHLQGIGNFAGDANSDLLWVSDSGAANIWKVNGGSVIETPLNVPTGSSLGLKDGTLSQSAPALSDPAQLTGTNHTLIAS
jgi:hypothetical protein